MKIGRSRWSRPLPRPPADAGFTMVEVLTAMTVFTIVVTVTLGLILKTAEVTGSNSRRVVAAGLANRQIESARSLLATEIPNGAQTRNETVGGVTYTVTQTANYLAPDASTSVCTGSGSQLAYKLVTVTVTWPAMGRTTPVRADTLRTIGVGEGLDATLGSLAIAVTNASGAAVPGVVLTAAGQQVTTGDDGCAVVTDVDPGTYTATVAATGYVGSTNAQATGLAGLVVGAGGITRGTLLYDLAHTVTLSSAAGSGFQVPAGLNLTLRDTYLPQQAYPSCAVVSAQGCQTGFPGSAMNLFPAVYDVWAGGCADAAVPTTVDLTGSALATGPVPVGVGRAVVDVQTGGVSQPGRVVYAVHAADPAGPNPGCVAGETWTLPATAAGGVSVVLPFGTWKFSLTPVPPGSAPSATLGTGAPASVVVVAP
jgi:prepilin-type N-terminal cleavage/methylation domain-containing protein